MATLLYINNIHYDVLVAIKDNSIEPCGDVRDGVEGLSMGAGALASRASLETRRGGGTHRGDGHDLEAVNHLARVLADDGELRHRGLKLRLELGVVVDERLPLARRTGVAGELSLFSDSRWPSTGADGV